MSDIGKWFEGKTQDALKEIQAEGGSMYYRFPDSNAARNYLAAQPGDHMLLTRGIAILMEEKCSEAYESLSSGFSSLWSKKQAAQHRVWHRSNNPSWVLFCDRTAEKVEIWDGRVVANMRVTGKRLTSSYYPIATAHISNLKGLILMAVEYELGGIAQ